MDVIEAVKVDYTDFLRSYRFILIDYAVYPIS